MVSFLVSVTVTSCTTIPTSDLQSKLCFTAIQKMLQYVVMFFYKTHKLKCEVMYFLYMQLSLNVPNTIT